MQDELFILLAVNQTLHFFVEVLHAHAQPIKAFGLSLLHISVYLDVNYKFTPWFNLTVRNRYNHNNYSSTDLNGELDRCV